VCSVFVRWTVDGVFVAEQGGRWGNIAIHLSATDANELFIAPRHRCERTIHCASPQMRTNHSLLQIVYGAKGLQVHAIATAGRDVGTDHLADVGAKEAVGDAGGSRIESPAIVHAAGVRVELSSSRAAVFTAAACVLAAAGLQLNDTPTMAGDVTPHQPLLVTSHLTNHCW
jgi:hypothetical protein